ncbi:TIGR04053 family radical SAM/SPASM domain-containing protein [Candidatus Parvarchaeota archaeon]|nr:TIGR04053 family radical SAM/SPASM domain-containing protein [Candidatus Parvarchaeota archaeon]
MAFSNRPVLVFWETTRACSLACVHCRASAIDSPLPGELTTEEGFDLLDEITSFCKPYPLLIFTGGDPLKRTDIFQQIKRAREKGINCALSPAVSWMLTDTALNDIKKSGCNSISISLDGCSAETHDSIRKVSGTYEKTLSVIKKAVDIGLKVQINTTVMDKNLIELPGIFHIVKSLGVDTWELFFLIKTGRGTGVMDVDSATSEDICNFVYDASFYGVIIRCVEAPFIRRVVALRESGNHAQGGEIYNRMRKELLESDGLPVSAVSTLSKTGTLDGDGTIFIGYDGSIYPGGFLPCKIGDIKRNSLIDVYRNNPLLKSIRNREFAGQCGICQFKHVCGGSRARAYAYNKDPLGTDPACIVACPAAKV